MILKLLKMKKDIISIDILIDLETILIAKLRPIFLLIDYSEEDDDIYIVISTLAFKRMSVNERVSSVFNLLKEFVPDIFKEKLIIIQAYDSDEISEMLENLNEEI